MVWPAALPGPGLDGTQGIDSGPSLLGWVVWSWIILFLFVALGWTSWHVGSLVVHTTPPSASPKSVDCSKQGRLSNTHSVSPQSFRSPAGSLMLWWGIVGQKTKEERDRTFRNCFLPLLCGGGVVGSGVEEQWIGWWVVSVASAHQDPRESI